jgi:hypothetical protein
MGTPVRDQNPTGTMNGLRPEDLQLLYGMAGGGTAQKPMMAMVGEQGPEIAMLQPGSQIIPLNRMPKAADGLNYDPALQYTSPATTGPAAMAPLLNPSRQYLNRMGPTAQQMYYGYEQMRTGANPEEQQWRLWSMAPPSGQNTGLQYRRR